MSQSTPLRKLASLALIAALLLIGCAPSASVSPSPTAGSAGVAATPWQQELANLEPDGTRSLESALRLFAMAFGPIPGVDVPVAEVGTVDSASPAVRAVRQHFDELTVDQRAAVERYLGVPADSTTLDIPPATTDTSSRPAEAMALSGALVAANPYFELDNEVVQEALRARSRTAEYFGDIPDIKIRTTSRPEPFVSFFVPQFGANGFETCDVILNRNTANVDRFATRRALTLDVVHCFQSWAMGSEAGFMRQVPAWAWEGPAEYIVLTLWPTQKPDQDAWDRYTKLPDIPLFERAYDAIGYYSQLFEAGLSLGDAFRAVLTDTDNPGRFAAAGTTADQFLDQWASELAGIFDWGDGWSFAGPGFTATPTTTPRSTFTVTNGSEQTFTQGAYSNHLFAMHSSADVVSLDFEGRARLSDGAIDIILGSATFCTRPAGCPPCPDGTPPEAPPLSLDSILALSGGTEGTIGTVIGERYEDHCHQTPRPSHAPEPCNDDCATSAGDPHIITINGSEYDFQAAGEFVLFRSPDRSFEIQARQEPWEDDDFISINTAVAMRVGASRLVITEAGEAVSVAIDGAAVPSGQQLEIAGTTVQVEDEGYAAYFPDGARVIAFGLGDGIEVVFDPSATLRESGNGIFGDVSPDSMGVPTLPDGTVLPPTDDRAAYNAALYGTFADAWRVTAETTLFDYALGSTTETYTLPDFPERVLTLSDLTADQRAFGEGACGGIEVEALFEMCVFDVGATNDLGFTFSYDMTQNVVETGEISASETVTETRPPR